MSVEEERMDTEEEGADRESPNCEEESEIEDSDRSSSSETESSEVDEDTIDHRKSECIADGQELEHAFQLVKNLLYDEKMKKIDMKLIGLKDESAQEYLQPIKVLTEKFERKIQISEIRKDLKLKLIQVQFESETLAAHQNLENDKRQLYDTVKNELEEKIRRLEEDRHNIDIHSDLWESQLFPKKAARLKRGTSTAAKERRKKPILVSSPYIIYMLEDMEVVEDWTLIKKAVKQKQQTQRRSKAAAGGSLLKDKFIARYQDGRLNYQREHYSKGDGIIIDNKADSPVHATITAINTGEIWVKKEDGNKSKLYIAQLQRGKYTIRHKQISKPKVKS